MTAATTLVALVLLNACDDFGTGRDVYADGCESFVHSITRSALIWPVCFVALDGGERQHLPLGGGRGLLRRAAGASVLFGRGGHRDPLWCDRFRRGLAAVPH
jgi:hypothetical protein